MLRFVDLLIFLLQTQGDTLKRLAAFFGEEELITLLETAGENENGDTEHDSAHPFLLQSEWFIPPSAHSGRNGASYYELEDAVREAKLPSQLEFHLWAYPFYRHLIESGVELDALIQTSTEDSLDILITEALGQAKAWVHQLPIPPSVFPPAESAAMTPWLRFRARILQKAGKKVLSPLRLVKS